MLRLMYGLVLYAIELQSLSYKQLTCDRIFLCFDYLMTKFVHSSWWESLWTCIEQVWSLGAITFPHTIHFSEHSDIKSGMDKALTTGLWWCFWVLPNVHHSDIMPSSSQQGLKMEIIKNVHKCQTLKGQSPIEHVHTEYAFNTHWIQFSWEVD